MKSNNMMIDGAVNQPQDIHPSAGIMKTNEDPPPPVMIPQNKEKPPEQAEKDEETPEQVKNKEKLPFEMIEHAQTDGESVMAPEQANKEAPAEAPEQAKDEEDSLSTAPRGASKVSFKNEPDQVDIMSSTTQSPPHATCRRSGSSLQLRKLPVNVLLMPGTSEATSLECGSETPTKRGLLRMTCLNPKFTLRTQLMLSFGSVNFITIFLVVLVCVVVSLMAGENIKDINQETFQNTANTIQGRTARYLAESLEQNLYPKDVVQTIYELTRDRFQGFPQVVSDDLVPFRDMDTNTSRYPIVGTPLPLDWQIQEHVTISNDQEHVQGRRNWYGNASLSTRNGYFIMQGACDPNVTDPRARTYWPNCTEANNNITTGGTLAPSNLTQYIHRKASDLVPAMKALYEYNQYVREIGVYFANQGVGATVNFPHYALDGNHSYVSTGCEWMKSPNPYDKSRPIGKQEEIDRCSENGTRLLARQYNPLERGWCQNQALRPEKILVEGVSC